MQQETPTTPTNARITSRRKISPFWLLPLIALLIAGWLIWSNYQERGTTVTIDFASADGIVPGRTPVRYQGVEVGLVQGISMTDDLRTIKIKASIKSDMKDALRDQTQFWLVTPKASLAGVSGLDALVGGNGLAFELRQFAIHACKLTLDLRDALIDGIEALLRIAHAFLADLVVFLETAHIAHDLAINRPLAFLERAFHALVLGHGLDALGVYFLGAVVELSLLAGKLGCEPGPVGLEPG